MSDLKINLVALLTPIIAEDAEAIAAAAINRGDGPKWIDLLTKDDTARAMRSLLIEEQERRKAQVSQLAEETRSLRLPVRKSDEEEFALRGGQPGNWFTDEPAYDGGAAYVPAGAAVREEMSKKVRSAFAR
jgi:hypothetical protein